MNEKINGLWVMHSSEPLPNELEIIKRIYVPLIACFLIGFILDIQVFMGIGAMGTMLWIIFDHIWSLKKLVSLRDQDFKFKDGITYDEIFEKLQPTLISKYGPSMCIERCAVGSDNIINVNYDNMIYQIFLHGDSFRIRWGKSFARAWAPSSNYKDYKKAIVGMGIVGYEIQRIFEIK